MEIILANPRGFCAGVHRAIEIVDRALELFGAPIYVRHEVVHNRYVVDNLKQKGAIFIEDLKEVPENATLIFSAHGVSKAVKEEAIQRNLKIFDATCPLVTKVHMEVARASYRGDEVILIGHAGHIEVEGTLGQYTNPNGGIYLVESIEDIAHLNIKDPTKLLFTTQTTLSVEDTKQIIAALLKRFPTAKGPRKDDICYATTNRQEAVTKLAEYVEVILVVGSKNSSNSNRLVELAKREGKQAYLIDCAEDICKEWLNEQTKIGLTAGASAPDVLIQEVVNHLQEIGNCKSIELPGILEEITFEIPKALRIPIQDKI